MSLAIALPASVALFKQQSMLKRESIDEELKETRHSESSTTAAVKPMEVREIVIGEPIKPKPVEKPAAPVIEEKKDLGELV